MSATTFASASRGWRRLQANTGAWKGSEVGACYAACLAAAWLLASRWGWVNLGQRVCANALATVRSSVHRDVCVCLTLSVRARGRSALGPTDAQCVERAVLANRATAVGVICLELQLLLVRRAFGIDPNDSEPTPFEVSFQAQALTDTNNNVLFTLGQLAKEFPELLATLKASLEVSRCRWRRVVSCCWRVPR